jgi:hypothetical protein
MPSTCAHEGFHSITSRYDQRRKILAFVVTCDGCGAELRKVPGERYSPQYVPYGSDRYLATHAGVPQPAARMGK